MKEILHLEMSHLQSSAKWQFRNDDTCSHNTPSMLICTLNTSSLKPHINDITNDYDIMSSDIIYIQEVHMQILKINDQF